MPLVLGLDLEHSCPWPQKDLSSERLSLASDFFCVLGLGLELCVLDSTSGLRYVPLVMKAKRNAVGLFQCSLAEDGTMFVLSYFYTKQHRLQRAFETSIMQKFVLQNFFK